MTCRSKKTTDDGPRTTDKRKEGKKEIGCLAKAGHFYAHPAGGPKDPGRGRATQSFHVNITTFDHRQGPPDRCRG